MIKYVKYYLIMWGARTPLIVGILALIFIWFIREPYYSDMDYLTGRVICYECGGKYGSTTDVCSSCTTEFKDSASVKALAHCSYCNDAKVYRNGTKECKECGHTLKSEGLVKLNDLGFSSIKEYRKAKMFDNLQIVLNHKISISVVIISVALVIYSWIKKLMKRLIVRKYMKGLRGGGGYHGSN